MSVGASDIQYPAPQPAKISGMIFAVNAVIMPLNLISWTLIPWWLSDIPFKCWEPLAYWQSITWQKTGILDNIGCQTSTWMNPKIKGGGSSSVKLREKWGRPCSLTTKLAFGSVYSAVWSCVCCRHASIVEISYNRCTLNVKHLLSSVLIHFECQLQDSKVESYSRLIAWLCVLLNEAEKL